MIGHSLFWRGIIGITGLGLTACSGPAASVQSTPSRYDAVSTQAATTACATLATGAACTFSTSEGTAVSATCQPSWEGDGTLVCLSDTMEHDGPPQTAIDACASQVAGAACTFVSRHGDTINGACNTDDDSGNLTCRAASPHDGSDGEGSDHADPSQAAIDACATLAADATCTFVGHDGQSLTGTCNAGRDGTDPLTCRPTENDDDTGGDHAGLPQAAIDACATLAADAACTVTGHDGQSMTGTCQQIPMDPSGSLVCFPATSDMP